MSTRDMIGEHPCHYTNSDPMILALCPRQCACDNDKLVTECSGQPMGIVPFTLNPHLTVLKAVDVQLEGFQLRLKEVTEFYYAIHCSYWLHLQATQCTPL